MDATQLGNRIKQLREARGLTQEELASLAGVGTKHISVLERGVKMPRLETFISIADALNATPNDLLTDLDTPTDFGAAISYKVSQLPVEKQEKLHRILSTLINEI